MTTTTESVVDSDAPTRMRVSASKIDTWMHCQLQAKFIYHDRLPRRQNAAATFGTCVHKALEQYNNTGNLDHALEVFTDLWENPEKIGATPEVWPARMSYGGLRQRGLDMIRNYHEKLRWDARDVIATEHSFLVPFGRYDLTGIIDLLEVRKSGRGQDMLLVVDYKTSTRLPNVLALKVNVQFTAYLYAVQQPEFWHGNDDFPAMVNGEYWHEMLKDLPQRAVYYHLESGREYDVGLREEFDYMRLYRVCQMIERAERHKVYLPNISGETCTYCSFTEQCGLPIHADTPDEEAWL